MPSEVRHLMFSPREALAAVEELRRRRGAPLMSGTGKVAQIITSPEIGFRVVIVAHDGATEREYVVGTVELGAALVFYCINNGIPLPVSAPKLLRISGDSVVLVVHKNVSESQLEQLRGPAPSPGAPGAVGLAHPRPATGEAADR